MHSTLRVPPPFAEQLGLFYRAPLSPVPLAVIVGAALLEALLTSGRPGLVSGLLLLVLSVAKLRYGLGLLQRFAQGYFDPSAHVASDHDHPNTVYKVLAALLVASVFASLMGAAMPPLAWLWAVAFVAVMPAIVMRVSTTHSIGDGLSLPGWLRLMSTLGSTYGWLLGMGLLVLLGAGLTGSGLAWLARGGPVAHALAAVVGNYALLVVFCMMGYAMHEKAEALGIETREAAAARWSPSSQSHVRQAAPGEVDALLAEGDVEGAFALAKEAARLELTDPKVQERYFKLLELKGETDKLPLQATRWLKACITAKRAGDCARIVERWWPTHPDLLDDAPVLVLQCARLAAKGQLVQEPLAMVQRFQRLQTGSVLLPQAMLIEADLLFSRLRDHAAAQAKLAELMQRFPQAADEIKDAQVMLSVIDAVAQNKGRPASPTATVLPAE